jgi:hypothetical protein
VSEVVGTNTICRYSSTSGEVLVQFNSDMTSANFAAAKAAAAPENPTNVSGFGDQAFSTTMSISNTLQILKGDRGLLITGPVSLTQIEALANQILSKL